MNDKQTVRALRDANLTNGSATGVAILDALESTINDDASHLKDSAPAILPAPFRYHLKDHLK